MVGLRRYLVAAAIATALAALSAVLPARAQTSPNWQTGHVPPASEWNSLFASKADASALALYMPLNGGNMLGPITLPADPTLPGQAATKSYVDGQVILAAGGGIGMADEATFIAGTTPETPVGGIYQTTPTANPLTNGETGAAQMTINRAWFTNWRNATTGLERGTSSDPIQVSLANTGANGTALAVAAAQSGTWAITGISGTVSLPTGAATSANQTTELASLATIATNTGAATPAGANTIGAVTQSGTWNITNLSGTVSLPTGAATSANQTTELASLATIATNTGAATPAGTNLIGAVNAQPATSGGLTVFFLQPTASDNHANIKNGAGQVYHIKATNNSATINYLRLYNAATGFNGCASATNLVDQWAIPAATTGAGFIEDIAAGIAFSTGISICVTSGYATTDATAATASAMSVSVSYK